MSIRKKIILLFILSFAILTIVLLIISHTFLLNKFVELERRDITQNIFRLRDTLKNDQENLSQTVSDWANWDDTYHFIENRNNVYIAENLADSTYKDLHLNLILYLNKKGKIVFGKFVNLQTETEITGLHTVQRFIASQILSQFNENKPLTGIVLLPQGPLLVVAKSILKNDKTGPSRGILVMGYFINRLEIQRLSKTIHLPIKIARYLPGQYRLISKNSYQDQKNRIFIKEVNDHQITGYTIIHDFTGKPALIVSIMLPRTILEQGRMSITYYSLAFLLTGIAIVILMLIFLKKVILDRLTFFNRYINQITASNDLTIRIPKEANDELTGFAQLINQMMDNLQLSYDNLTNIIEFLPDATFVINHEHQVVAWNRAMEEMTAILKKDIINKGNYAYAIPFYGKAQPVLIDLVRVDEKDIKQYYEHYEKQGDVLYTEVFSKHLNHGNGAYLWAKASPLYNKKGEIIGAVQSIRDITKRKQTEDQLKYLSLHDPMTELYNRTYFEEEFRRLDSGRSETVGIIVCDVDGLKLANDSLGHKAGDVMLKATAQVLKGAFRDVDVVARIGGDEFAIFLPGANEAALEQAELRIQEGVSRYNEHHPKWPLSISVGWAFRTDTSVRLKHVFEEADNNMYRAKTLRNQSARNAIVKTLMVTLGSRDFITEGHAERLKDIMIGLSKKIGYSDSKIGDLILLAQFHDIGKVGIPDNILLKPGPLNPEEREIMQHHSEIGYTIAQSASQEIARISEWILMHHERWDGQGYPRGLKGEEIPLECRILAIADAYDAMTNDRPYRKALSQQEAIMEIRNCSGSQFDPELVKEFLKAIEERNAFDTTMPRFS